METIQHIGFTGTRQGMTGLQKNAVKTILNNFDGKTFHHGDCIGADEEAHYIADELGYEIHIYPPLDDKYVAHCRGYVRYVKRAYLERNQMIVRATNLLIATPKEFTEQRRSGTWATIRYARHLKKNIIIVYPDGNSLGRLQ